MIQLENVTKKYKVYAGTHTVLNNINLKISKGEKVGILGANGSGKSTLVRILAGVESPDEGRITKGMSISWPIAFKGAFQGNLTGMDNIKFLCRIYNIQINNVIDYIENFTSLGKYLYEPVSKYSSGMRARLGFAASMAINFDCLLIDEVIAIGDARFLRYCNQELFVNRAKKSLVLVSHQEKTIRRYCQKAYVLHNARLYDFPDLNSAFLFYKSLLK